MSLFERISEQLQSIESRLNSLRRELNRVKASPDSIEEAISEVDVSTKELGRSIGYLNLFYDVSTQLDNGLSLNEAISQALQSIWDKIPLSYAVLILGEAELGPYQYYGMQGIPDPGQYIGKECPFPLSGVLAQTLLRKLDPDLPDYLCIDDIRMQKRPSVDEFPWLPMHGSVLILPLRLNNRSLAKGVLILGRSVQGGFSDSHLRQEFEDIAKSLAQLLYRAQMRHELTKHTEQLVNVQLLTREIARAQSVDDVLHMLTQKIAEVINDIDVEIYLRSVEAVYDPLIDPNEPGLYLYESNGYIDKTLSTQIQQMFAWTMRVGEPIFYHPARLFSEPEHPFYSVSGPAMVVPIVGKDHIFGVIQLIAHNNGRHLDETDTLVMRAIANSVAVALKSIDLELGKAQAQINSLQTLISVAEEQTGVYAGHSQRVAHNAGLMARTLGLQDKAWSNIRAAATLHNVSVLIQPGSLSGAEAIDIQIAQQQQIALSTSLLRQMGVHMSIVHLVEQIAHPYAAHEGMTALGDDASPFDPHFVMATAEFTNGSAHEESGYRTAHDAGKHRNLRHQKQPLTSQNAAVLGSQIICLADMFDTWICAASRRQTQTIEMQLLYLDAQAGLTLDSSLVALFQTLLKENRLLLPGRSKRVATL